MAVAAILDLFEPQIAPLQCISAVSENLTLEPNMKCIGDMAIRIFRYERSVGRSVVNIYILSLISYTPLRYVRNVARKE